MESMGEEICPFISLGPLLVTDLPDSILLHIFSYLPFSSICQVSQVCHRWNQIASDELLWRSVFLRHYKLPLSTTFPEKAVSWRSEFKRLFYHTPAVLVEELKEHKDEVLHVSFSHDGTMFATCSKDGYVKVWSTVTSPVSLVFKMDTKSRFNWDFTQFSQFNESDTCLLVSGVFLGRLTTSGEIAIFNLQDDFQMQSRVPNKPYDVFGAWFDDDHLLSGTLFSGEGMRSVSSIWLSKASQEVESEMESVSMVLYRFHNVNCSSVRLINVAQTGPLKSEQEELTGCERSQDLPCSSCDSHTDCYQPSLLDKLLCKEISEEEFDIENEDWDDDYDGNVFEEGAKKCKSNRSPTFGFEHGDLKNRSEESVSGLGFGAQMDQSVRDRCVSESAITSADFHQNSSWLCLPGDGRRCRKLAYHASRPVERDIFKDADLGAAVADTSNNASLFSSNETSCVSDSTDCCAGMDAWKDEDFFLDFSMMNPPPADYLQKSLDPSLNDRFCAHSSSIEIRHSSGVASVDATLKNSLSHCIDLEKEDMHCVQSGEFLSQEFSRSEGESPQAIMSRESSPDQGNVFTTPESIGCVRLREHPPATDGLSQSFHSSMSVSSESEFASQASSLSNPCFSCDNAQFSTANGSSPPSQKFLGQSSEVGTGLTLSQPPASKVPKYSVDSPTINGAHVPVASDPSSSLTCNHQGCRKQHLRQGQAQFRQKRCRCPPEKLLIYTWGSKTFTPHKIGIKRVKWTDFSKVSPRFSY
ncbi:F-box/WD repeat-containing protein 5 [Plakobranchus ocellatus]|uniref:F-box/WD repeat-containing protein 5 n=1 Tax=Plakobranchus ocellatus TaxID=259542 RepID=A0AAV3Y3J5_9GAST|nr:F-box/WD repeat-containing protein 5 [Plakobranchus ocellatus]